MTNTYTSDVQLLLQFAEEYGFDISDLAEACFRLKYAIAKDLSDYSIPKEIK